MKQENESVNPVWGIGILFWEQYKTHNSVCKQNLKYLSVKSYGTKSNH